MKNGNYIFSIYLAAAFVVQLVSGPFPGTIFEFPVNAAVLFAGIAGLWVLYREKPTCKLSRWLVSGHTSILLISALLIVSLILGLVPQFNSAAVQQACPAESDRLSAELSARFGIHDIIHTWWFIAIIIALMANLLMVIFSREGKPRFLLNHVGVFLALAGGFFGTPDTSVRRAPVYKDNPTREIFSMDGKAETARYEMSMTGFEIEQGDNGSVQNYKAFVTIDNDPAEIQVNHPYRRNAFEDIYLVGYDQKNAAPEYCVLEIVRQPWKHIMWLGIILMMAGCILMFIQGAEKKEDKI